jgi:TRAP-type C4-dicarboxylate transport system substrate-binding protein
VYSSLPADDSSAHYIWFNRFQENINKNERLKGQIKLNYFANAMLGKEADATQQVRIGAINMMISGTSIWATLVPKLAFWIWGICSKITLRLEKRWMAKSAKSFPA